MLVRNLLPEAQARKIKTMLIHNKEGDLIGIVGTNYSSFSKDSQYYLNLQVERFKLNNAICVVYTK